jgi:hypothetical protein
MFVMPSHMSKVESLQDFLAMRHMETGDKSIYCTANVYGEIVNVLELSLLYRRCPGMSFITNVRHNFPECGGRMIHESEDPEHSGHVLYNCSQADHVIASFNYRRDIPLRLGSAIEVRMLDTNTNGPLRVFCPQHVIEVLVGMGLKQFCEMSGDDQVEARANLFGKRIRINLEFDCKAKTKVIFAERVVVEQ